MSDSTVLGWNYLNHPVNTVTTEATKVTNRTNAEVIIPVYTGVKGVNRITNTPDLERDIDFGSTRNRPSLANTPGNVLKRRAWDPTVDRICNGSKRINVSLEAHGQQDGAYRGT